MTRPQPRSTMPGTRGVDGVQRRPQVLVELVPQRVRDRARRPGRRWSSHRRGAPGRRWARAARRPARPRRGSRRGRSGPRRPLPLPVREPEVAARRTGAGRRRSRPGRAGTPSAAKRRATARPSSPVAPVTSATRSVDGMGPSYPDRRRPIRTGRDPPAPAGTPVVPARDHRTADRTRPAAYGDDHTRRPRRFRAATTSQPASQMTTSSRPTRVLPLRGVAALVALPLPRHLRRRRSPIPPRPSPGMAARSARRPRRSSSP